MYAFLTSLLLTWDPSLEPGVFYDCEAYIRGYAEALCDVEGGPPEVCIVPGPMIRVPCQVDQFALYAYMPDAGPDEVQMFEIRACRDEPEGWILCSDPGEPVTYVEDLP